MLKNKLKSILLEIGLLTYLVDFKKKYFPSTHDKSQALLIDLYTEFYSDFIKKGDLCFDIGAHTGSRVESFLACGARVVAVEPYLPCVKFMRAKFGSLIKVVPKGVGAKVEIKKMHISDDPTTNSFSDTWISKVTEKRFEQRDWKKTEMVQVTTIDALIKEYGVPKFCKIDVEGFELEVLKGMNSVIPMLSFEYIVPENTRETIYCIRKLNDLDPEYRFNYSEGETLVMGLPEFVGLEEFELIVNSPEFIQSSCGDVYVSNSNENKIA